MYLLAVSHITPFAEQMDVDLLKKGKKKNSWVWKTYKGETVLLFSKLQFPREEVGESILQEDLKQLVKVQMK